MSVYFDTTKEMWIAKKSFNNVVHYIGQFDTEEEGLAAEKICTEDMEKKGNSAGRGHTKKWFDETSKQQREDFPKMYKGFKNGRQLK